MVFGEVIVERWKDLSLDFPNGHGKHRHFPRQLSIEVIFRIRDTNSMFSVLFQPYNGLFKLWQRISPTHL